MSDPIPSRHDSVTIECPFCRQPFVPSGRRRYCSDACRAAAYRRRRGESGPEITVPGARPRKPITVYECDGCGLRSLGEQRCPECSTFMRKLGIGGECPHCELPVAIIELVEGEVTVKS